MWMHNVLKTEPNVSTSHSRKKNHCEEKEEELTQKYRSGRLHSH